jgi:3-isopropylmalate dehydrogenase
VSASGTPVSIAVLPGDGIGPEVVAQAERALRRVRPDLVLTRGHVGAAAIDACGSPLPTATLELCERSAAILFGAVGDRRFDGAPSGNRPEFAILQLRKHFDLYANMRPVRVMPGLEHASTLREEVVRGVDLIVARESTSGLYFGQPKKQYVENGVEAAVDTLVYRRPEIERVARVAFEWARARRKHVTSVDKQNVLESGRLWHRVVDELHAVEFPDVALDHLLVDNAAMQLLRTPAWFDVILTENTFGDILSDEAAMLTGSLGNVPSATLGAVNGVSRFGLYEPISGTAPDIAGKGIANPVAALISAALLCRYSLADEEAATKIERAVDAALAGGARTPDLASAGEAWITTAEFGDRVLAALELSA